MAAAAAAAAAPPPPSAAAAPLPHRGSSPYPSMNALRSALRHSRSPFSAFFSPPFHPLSPRRRCRPRPPTASLPSRASGASRARAKVKPASVLDTAPKDPWLASLSLPAVAVEEEEGPGAGASTGWAIGVDPDTSGALAVLAPDGSSQVYDNPYLHMVVAEYIRKRLDTRSIIQLVRGLGAPPGTPAYIEKSSPFPTDGKLGWWSTGFSYGLWIGILVASGFSVVPVASQTWKAYFGLTRSESPKDDSRQTASILFPDKALSLKRKKHHGRAEALLIAAYGKGLSLPSGRLNKP